MKIKNLFLLAILTATNEISFAQKMPSDYFEESLNFFEQKQYDSALIDLQFIVNNYPKDELVPRALYNIGYIYYLTKNYTKSTEIFNKILVSDFNEKEALGGDIMSDPYTNYKHRAAQFLYSINIKTGHPRVALHFLVMADTVYPYLHFCGNELEENNIDNALKYAYCYKKLNLTDSALIHLFPYAFNESLASNKEVITETEHLLDSLHTQADIKEELKKSFNEIKVNEFTSNGKKQKAFFISVFGANILIRDYYDDKSSVSSQISDLKKWIEKSDLYNYYINGIKTTTD